ncbi:MAG: site-specific integrase [Bacteroidales bacterium]|nr:site-specific integrase [Bacteroidales bacterium]
MTTKFYLKKGRKKIFLRVCIGKEQNDYTTGLSADTQYWDSKRQRIKHTAVLLDKVYINNILNDIDTQLKTFEYQCRLEHKEINQDDIKRLLSNVINGKDEDKPKTLRQFISEYVEQAKHRQSITTGKPLTEDTIRKFKNFQSLFDEYCKAKHKEFDFADINISFYDDFKEFLQNTKQYAINTIGKYIRTFKTILNEATTSGTNTNLIYQNARFKVTNEDVSKIYLSVEELEKIEALNLNDELNKTRQAFLLGCYTGLRYSDYSRLTNDNISENKYIRTIQQKTGGEVVIPLFPYVRNLINNNRLENIADVPDWKINREIKTICQRAGINDKVIKVQTKGGKKQQTTTEKWEEVSTHTARRSFATNLYLQGVPTTTIMKITGHKTETAFLKYIRITNKENADLLAETIKKA